jgi:hypothetical protein
METTPGTTKQLVVDTVVSQGVTGAEALDRIIRTCLQHEPGAALYVSVAYSQLRLGILTETVVSTRRVFLPDQMTLYVEPMDGAKRIRVQVFRSIICPDEPVHSAFNKRKADDTLSN